MLPLVLLAQLAVGAPALPVLSFPSPGLDDSVAYQGYVTRLHRDAAGNTLQIYLDRRQGRVVHVWADGENESIGFSARNAAGAPVDVRWGGPGGTTAQRGRQRWFSYPLIAAAPDVDLGWFLLGSMRVERDFQYWGWHRAPFDSATFELTEFRGLLDALGQLDPATRRQHVASLHAASIDVLRRRLQPTLMVRSPAMVRVVQPSLDGLDTLAVELSVDPSRTRIEQRGGVVRLHASTGETVAFTVRLTTTGAALHGLTRDGIFTPQFLTYLRDATRDSTTASARWLERNVRGVELLASREKLMAGLPTYGTYFGRDMLVATLMMRPIWRPEMSEFAIAAALRKLSPDGQVSHEEALGGQADREAAAEYAGLVRAAVAARTAGARPDSLLRRAGRVLADHRRVRENYHMIDDEFQLPVLTGRWLADPRVSAEHQRAFLRAPVDGEPRITRLLRELALVCRMTRPYAADPVAVNLVSFPAGSDGRWSSASWRDSGAGYAGGRFAMDVNAIWAPHALESIAIILDRLAQLGWSLDSLGRAMPELQPGTPLGTYLRDRASLHAAIATWQHAASHFVVTLSPDEVRAGVEARLSGQAPAARDYWTTRLGAVDSLTFLTLALDADGKPIRVVNTDPATRLFLGEHETSDSTWNSADARAAERDVAAVVREYPVGLLLPGIGPAVANDAYAPVAVQSAFDRDAYHGPKVVWGREVNLFVLGAARRAALAHDAHEDAHAHLMREAIERVRSAVDAAGFRSELWSYDWRDGRPVPARYGSGGDVQLWSTTDLVVQYILSTLPR